MKTHFHMKGFAPSLALIEKLKATRKWPIAIQVTLTYCKVNQKCMYVPERKILIPYYF